MSLGSLVYLYRRLENRVHQIPLPQHASFPIVDEWNNERQQAHTVIWRQDGYAEQVAEADQHKEMLQTAALFRQSPHLIVDRHAVKNLAEGADGMRRCAFHTIHIRRTNYPP